MTSTLTLQVSSPDGGRLRTAVVVPLSANLKVVVQQACVRLGLCDTLNSPSCNNYGLKHGRIQLDLATPIRLSGLSPNAKLVLVELEGQGRGEQERGKRGERASATEGGRVSVALQYAGDLRRMQGLRLCGEFSCDMSLLEILAELERTSAGRLALLVEGGEDWVLAPQLVILTLEVKGLDALSRTSPSSLGITQGRCLIRMTHKPDGCMGMLQAQEWLLTFLRSSKETAEMVSDSIENQEETVETVGDSIGKQEEMVETAPGSTPIQSETKKMASGSTHNQSGTEEMASDGGTTISTRTDQSPSQLEDTQIPTPSSELPVDRQIIIYHPPEKSPRLANAPDLADNFYVLNESELRLQLASLHTNRRALEDAPLVSRAKLVEKQQAAFLAKNPTTRIRFRLPDQHLIEATFDCREQASTLYDFVESCLEGIVPFTLCMPLPIY